GFAEVTTAPGAAADVLPALAADPRVAVVEPNHLSRAAAVPSDPHYGANQSAYLDMLRLPAAWDLSTGADDLILAVVDSGVSLEHPELAGRLVPGRDVANDDNDPDDFYGHGTQVATVAAATGNDGAGMAGVAWRGKILPVKVLDSRGNGRDSDIAEGITWAVDQGADVINLSLFGRSSSSAVRAAVEYAVEQDVVVVAAAGNDHNAQKIYPAAYDGVIGVSAVAADGHLAPFSNYGPWTDLAAPGVDILAGWVDGTYRKVEGTSFSAPLVAGVAMLARAHFPDEDAPSIARRLQAGARDTGLIGRDDLFGYGIVDALGALGGARPDPVVPGLPASAGEPDNTPDRASVLTPATAASATLAPAGDVDWFSVDVPPGHDLSVTLTPPAGGDPGDWSVELFDPTLAPVGEASTVAMSGGRYSVRVLGDSPFAPQAPYRLTATFTPSSELPDEPGDPLWVRDTTPADGTWGGAPESAPGLRFSRALDPESLAEATVTLTDTATDDDIPGVAHYEADTNSIVFRPNGPLPQGRPYRLEVAGIRDAGGDEIPVAECCLRFGVPAPPPVPVPDPDPTDDPDPTTGPTVTEPGPARSGYWMLGAGGRISAFGDAPATLGDAAAYLHAGAADVEPTPSGAGYWIVDARGAVFAFGGAAYRGGLAAGTLRAGESVTSLSAAGDGYWLFTTLGRVFAFGDAGAFGDLAEVTLNGPVLDSIATPTGRGYYMVAADGGIFSGDARFFGSMGGVPLNAPVQSLVPDPDGTGYWLVAADGGVFSFEAGFRGSLGGIPLNAPVTGMVPYGDGYLMVGTDGGIFNFSDRPFAGSLGAQPPADPIVAVAVLR
ncbi:MAG: S8 family serine peptidase, partial [Acidimicrobiia bacterium]